MNILALEFSSARRSVAVASAGAEFRVLAAVAGGDFRAETGMALAARTLAEAGLAPADIGLIALGLGPGSYTGIRSSIAIAQGWQLGLGTPVAGVNSAELLAWQAAERRSQGRMRIIIDAQRGEVYSAIYEARRGKPELLEALRIIPGTPLPEEPGLAILGPEAPRFSPHGEALCPDAVMLARLALEVEPMPPERIEPIYLRAAAFVKAPAARQY